MIEIIRQLYEEKPSILEGETGEIHPIYEAIIALFRSQISDKTIKQRFLTGKKEDLKTLLVVDSLMERLKDNSKRARLENMLKQNEDAYKIVETAASILSEDRRITEEGIIKKLSSIQKDKYVTNIVRELIETSPRDIYLGENALKIIDAKKNKFKKMRYINYATISLMIVTLAIGAYKSWRFFQNHDIIEKKENPQINKYLTPGTSFLNQTN